MKNIFVFVLFILSSLSFFTYSQNSNENKGTVVNISPGKITSRGFGNVATFSVEVSSDTPVYSIILNIVYDTSRAEFKEVKLAPDGNWNIRDTTLNDTLTISASGSMPFDLSKKIELTYRLKNKIELLELNGKALIDNIQFKLHSLIKSDALELPYADTLKGPWVNLLQPQIFNYKLKKQSLVKLYIYDKDNKLVRKLIDEIQDAGNYKSNWNGKDDLGKAVASGMYIYTIEAENTTLTRKALIMK